MGRSQRNGSNNKMVPEHVGPSIGAPAQHTQPSRKGKKAWRKHVDLGHVERGLEAMREEERAVGLPLQKQTNSQLFTFDLAGDSTIAKSIQKSKPLKSATILAARSAIPAVLSRSTTSLTSAHPPKRLRISQEDKDRLLRIAKRQRKGPLNSLIDPKEVGAGSATLAPSEAVMQSGTYDVWDQEGSDDEFLKSLPTEEAREYLFSILKKPKIKAPPADPAISQVSVPPVLDPHQGTSYNPHFQAHQDLLLAAHKVEEQREAEVEKYRGVKEKMESARRVVTVEDGGAAGMIIDIPTEDAQDEQVPDSDLPEPKKPTKRKTRQQKVKALHVKQEQQASAERAFRKQLSMSISSLKKLRQSVDSSLTARERAMLEKKLVHQMQLKRGLAGVKIGKHVVPKDEINVQLGDELSESLRGLKPEGSLLQDRFISMQQRALIEPRSRIVPTRRKLKIKEYEKHAWKRFT